MQLLAPLIEAKEGHAYDADGTLCMVVVDPATRKLLIPCSCIYPTRAQQRATIPSLCQLFLQGRCRQGSQCHQVHAGLDTVVALRSQVGSLPSCCAFHGDEDIAGVLNERSWLSKVVLYIPESTYDGGYVPLSRVGYTIPISKMLNDLSHDAVHSLASYRDAIQDGCVPQEEPPVIVLEAGDIPICRLHIKERCRFAEECSFLHLCKEVAGNDPQLPLGRRSRLKAMQKECAYAVADSHGSNVLPTASLTPSTGCAATPHACPMSVRGFPLVQRTGVSGHSSLSNSLCANGGNSPWMRQMHGPSSIGQGCELSTVEAPALPAPIATPCSLGCGDLRQLKQRSDLRQKSSSRVLVSCESLLHGEGDAEAVEEGAPDPRSGNPGEGCRKTFSAIRGAMSDSMAASSRDEGTSSSSMSLSTSYRCCAGGKWRHDPYNLSRTRLGG